MSRNNTVLLKFELESGEVYVSLVPDKKLEDNVLGYFQEDAISPNEKALTVVVQDGKPFGLTMRVEGLKGVQPTKLNWEGKNDACKMTQVIFTEDGETLFLRVNFHSGWCLQVQQPDGKVKETVCKATDVLEERLGFDGLYYQFRICDKKTVLNAKSMFCYHRKEWNSDDDKVDVVENKEKAHLIVEKKPEGGVGTK